MVPKIGDLHEGGIVFYVDAVLGKGLTCSVVKQSAGMGLVWSPIVTATGEIFPEIETGAKGIGVFDGKENTKKILEAINKPEAYAAKLASQYSFGGFSDWYLPSKGEMELMHEQKDILQFDSESYWTSSESAVKENAWAFHLNAGTSYELSKAWPSFYSVRAIRTFTFEPEGPYKKGLISTSDEIKRHNSAVALELEPESIRSFLDDADLNHILPAIGQQTFDRIIDAKGLSSISSKESALLLLLQKAAVNFALGYYVNSGAVNISNAGISVTKSDKRLPASDKKLVALRRDCFEAAYGALEKAVDYLENNLADFPEYAASDEHKANRAYFINNSKDFQAAGVNIGNSAQLYQVLKTYLAVSESNNIEPLLGPNITQTLRNKILSGSASDKEKVLVKKIQQCVACFATAEAITYQALSLEADGVFVKSESVGGISGNTQNKNVPELRLLQQAMNRLVMKGESSLESLRKFLAANKADYSFTPPTPVILNDPNEDMNIYFI